MKYILLLSCLFLTSCGQFVLGPDRVVYQNFGGKLSCLGLRCCYPYGEKLMVCNEGNANGDGIFVRYYYDKK